MSLRNIIIKTATLPLVVSPRIKKSTERALHSTVNVAEDITVLGLECTADVLDATPTVARVAGSIVAGASVATLRSIKDMSKEELNAELTKFMDGDIQVKQAMAKQWGDHGIQWLVRQMMDEVEAKLPQPNPKDYKSITAYRKAYAEWKAQQ